MNRCDICHLQPCYLEREYDKNLWRRKPGKRELLIMLHKKEEERRRIELRKYNARITVNNKQIMECEKHKNEEV